MERPEFREILFPSFAELISLNNDLLYIGYSFQKKIVDDLYVYFDVINEDLIFQQSTKKIYIGWCNRDKHPISYSNFEYSKEGYLEALQFLDNTAKQFCEAFKFFNDTARVSEQDVD